MGRIIMSSLVGVDALSRGPDILFQNERWLAVDKPAGWLCVPGRGERQQPVLTHEMSRRLGVRLWPVHRLDREVTGVVLMAKDAESHRRGCLLFEGREVRKVYEAWTELGPAAPPGEVAEWRMLLERGKKRAYEAPHGKEAVTRARADGQMSRGGVALCRWELSPLTGRSHQLRVGLAKHYAPILGDALYGAAEVVARKAGLPPAMIALRARGLELAPHRAEELGLPAHIEAQSLEALCGKN